MLHYCSGLQHCLDLEEQEQEQDENENENVNRNEKHVEHAARNEQVHPSPFVRQQEIKRCD